MNLISRHSPRAPGFKIVKFGWWLNVFKAHVNFSIPVCQEFYRQVKSPNQRNMLDSLSTWCTNRPMSFFPGSSEPINGEAVQDATWPSLKGQVSRSNFVCFDYSNLFCLFVCSNFVSLMLSGKIRPDFNSNLVSSLDENDPIGLNV